MSWWRNGRHSRGRDGKKVHWNYEFMGKFCSPSKKAQSGCKNAKTRHLAGLGGKKHSILTDF
jgi:hypothetical protein